MPQHQSVDQRFPEHHAKVNFVASSPDCYLENLLSFFKKQQQLLWYWS
jgi:hypothetical protein